MAVMLGVEQKISSVNLGRLCLGCSEKMKEVHTSITQEPFRSCFSLSFVYFSRPLTIPSCDTRSSAHYWCDYQAHHSPCLLSFVQQRNGQKVQSLFRYPIPSILYSHFCSTHYPQQSIFTSRPAECGRSIMYILEAIKLNEVCTEIQVFSLLFAACAHHFQHP